MFVVTLVAVLCSIGTYIGWGFILDLICSTLCSIGTYIGWRVPLAILVLAIVGGIIAVTRSVEAVTRNVEVVRLLAAVVVGLLACLFVALYNNFARDRFRVDHPGETLSATPLGAFVTAHQQQVYAIPVLGLLLGCLIIWRWPKSKDLIELVVQALWILAFMWAGNVLIVWQAQNIPLFSGMRWHY